MMAAWRRLLSGRSARERAVAALVTCVVAALCYAWFIATADRARTRLEAGAATLRAQVRVLESQAAEVERLRALAPARASRTELRALVQSQAEAGGLARALVRVDVLDAGRVQVVFGAVRFSDWLAWVTAMQAQQARVESTRVEAMSAPGLVSVTTTLVRGAP